jgi:diketogulonate reductase-like aldo/keto reductase
VIPFTPSHATLSILPSTRFASDVFSAQAYGNEAEVGDGIIDSGVPREEIFLTTKIDNMEHKDVAKVVDESLKKLKTDYVDLILMHWPVSIGESPVSASSALRHND